MSTNHVNDSSQTKPYGSSWKPIAKALLVLLVLVFVVPTLIGFGILYHRDPTLRNAFGPRTPRDSAAASAAR
jgi:hypothetical protein